MSGTVRELWSEPGFRTDAVLLAVMLTLIGGELVAADLPQRLLLFAGACLLAVYVLPRLVWRMLCEGRAVAGSLRYERRKS